MINGNVGTNEIWFILYMKDWNKYIVIFVNIVSFFCIYWLKFLLNLVHYLNCLPVLSDSENRKMFISCLFEIQNVIELVVVKYKRNVYFYMEKAYIVLVLCWQMVVILYLLVY